MFFFGELWEICKMHAVVCRVLGTWSMREIAPGKATRNFGIDPPTSTSGPEDAQELAFGKVCFGVSPIH